MDNKLSDDIKSGIEALEHLREAAYYVEQIEQLVRDNPDFFDYSTYYEDMGTMAISLAWRKLALLTERWAAVFTEPKGITVDTA